MINFLGTLAFPLIVGAISLTAVPDRAQAQSYQIDCAILLCLSGGWPASVPCARAKFIRRITPWPVEQALQIWRCPMRAAYTTEPQTLTTDRIYDILFKMDDAPVQSLPRSPMGDFDLIPQYADLRQGGGWFCSAIARTYADHQHATRSWRSLGSCSHSVLATPVSLQSASLMVTVLICRTLHAALLPDSVNKYYSFIRKLPTTSREMTQVAPRKKQVALLQTIPGIGSITASAIVATIGTGKQFSTGRDFAAWLGLTPLNGCSGSKERLSRISTLLMVCR
jgi:hypothetical protein